ncbi:MAG: hypothetical protein DRH97_00195 [Chloroflexi bacterium]|nr:MAG: hypothetical protein DRH97_00195 [Chloroflexota bacterium]
MRRHQNNCCTTQNIYEVVTPNLNLAISLDEAWINCHKDFLVGGTNTEQDAWMSQAIKTATKAFEDVSRRTLMKTAFKTFRDCWQNCFELRKSPLVSIESVKYFDADSVEQTVDTGDYYIQRDPAYSLVRFDEDFDYPELKNNRPQQIVIDFIAGYAQDRTEVPADIQQAILMMVCFMDANRGDCGCSGTIDIARQSGAYDAFVSYKIEEIAL